MSAELDAAQLLSVLWNDVAGLRDRLTALETAAGDQTAGEELGERLEDLAEQVRVLAELHEAGGSDGPVWDWSAMTTDQATRAWQELTGWVEGVLLPRNPGLHVKQRRDGGIPTGGWADCWYAHPEAVEELSALYGTWKQAYAAKDRSAAKVAEWRDRWLPGTRTRLATVLAGCLTPTGGHKLPPDPAERRAAMYAYISNDLASRPAE